MSKDIKNKIAYFINIMIVGLTIIAFFVMFTDYHFMTAKETTIASSATGRIRFFTIDSNLLAGISSLLFLIQQRNLILGKIKEIKIRYYIYELVATCSVSLTFFIVLIYLSRITPYGFFSMYVNKNLFFHGIIPLLSIINFIFFEKTDRIKFKSTFLSLIPIFMYATYYITNILIHMENKYVSVEYDWYWFVQKGIWEIFIVVPLIFCISYFLSCLLWIFNKIIIIKKNKECLN